MQLNVSGHHVEVTAPLREYVESKFERLQRHFDQITNTQVTLTGRQTRPSVDQAQTEKSRTLSHPPCKP
jgi:ribosomal subunit interface protein